MSIQITINPATMTAAERAKLNAVLDMFASPASAQITSIGVISAPAVPIAPNDNPEAGVEQPSAAAAFAASTPAAVFTTTDNSLPAAAVGTPQVSAPASASIPAAPAAAAPNAPGVTVDSRGLPWDGRIHAETKSTNKDGSWRNKRGVDPAFIAHVETELRAVMSIPTAVAAPVVAASPVAPAPAAPTAATTFPAAHEVASPNVPPAPPAAPPAQPSVSAPVAPPPAPTTAIASPAAPVGAPPTNAESAAPSNFVELVGKIGPLLQSGKLTQDEVKAACGAVGVPELALLAPRTDLVPQVWATIQATLMTKG